MNQEVVKLHLADIIPNRFQPREVFDENALKELAISIKEHGVIQPIIVRKVNDKYEIIAGERRYKASQLAGLDEIPAIVTELYDKESSKVGLLENLQRKNLNPIEEAKTYKKILDLDNMTQEALAKTMGKSQSSVANKLRLLNLSEEVQNALLNAKISERHARALLKLEDQTKQNELLNRIINEKLSVRAVEEEINKLTPKTEEILPGIAAPIDSISMTDNYINSDPLNPTTQITVPEEQDNKIKIVGPDGEETNQFINYGEVDSNDTESTSENPPGAPGGFTEQMMPSIVTPDDIETNTQPPLVEVNTEPVQNEFINYGEVNKEEPKEDVPRNPFIPVDAEQIKANAQDITTPQQVNNSSSSIDNLLNINMPKNNTPSYDNIEDNLDDELEAESEGDNQEVIEEQPANIFINPAESIVKQERELDEDDTKPSGDYFKPSDLVSIELPDTVNTSNQQTEQVNLNSINQEVSNDPMTMNEAKQKLRDTIEDIKARGINISTQEMEFDTNYQMIVKIEKDQ